MVRACPKQPKGAPAKMKAMGGGIRGFYVCDLLLSRPDHVTFRPMRACPVLATDQIKTAPRCHLSLLQAVP